MNTILRTLVTTAATPFSYTIGLLKPKKKEAPPKEEKKEDNKDSGDEKKDLADTFIETEPSYSIFNEHDVEVNFTDRKDASYEVRLRSKAIRDADAHTNELNKFLRQNRELMQKAGNDIYKGLHYDIQTNLNYNQKHDAIKKGDLKPEKDNDKEAAEFAQILEDGPRNYCELHEKFIRPAVQNAVLARANIDMLIPLIRMRGGHVEFEGMEANPIHEHINAIRNQYVKQACGELKPPEKPKPPTDEWTMEEYFTAAIVVVIIALALKLFI
ncbi:MAG: hypothetical protein KAH03_03990 [Cocleimonas sp.]|nr:hypothetical protein [Cocleimonas sp.]